MWQSNKKFNFQSSAVCTAIDELFIVGKLIAEIGTKLNTVLQESLVLLSNGCYKKFRQNFLHNYDTRYLLKKNREEILISI